MTKVQFKIGDLVITVEGDKKSLRVIDGPEIEPSEPENPQPIDPKPVTFTDTAEDIIDLINAGFFRNKRTEEEIAKKIGITGAKLIAALEKLVFYGYLHISSTIRRKKRLVLYSA